MSIDLATLDTRPKANAGQELEVSHPGTGRPLGIKLILAGKDSDLWREAENHIAKERFESMVDRRTRETTPDDIRAEGIKILARCTVNWEGLIWEGKEIPCSFENAVMLYTNLPWLREQVDRFIADRNNFL